MQVKENQKELLQSCQDIIRFSKAKDNYKDIEKGRNRIEKRKSTIYYDQHGFIEDKQWAGHIKSIICIERNTEVFNTKEKVFKDRHESAIYISNYKVDAEQANFLIRAHWSIENKDHHVRDVTLREDESRIRVNPENMSTMRSFALNILRSNNVKNIKGETYQNSLAYYNLYSYQQFI